MRGGPSQLDTWDMKPDAPPEIRGEFRPIATTVPGIRICELLPRTARIMDKWSIVRSLQHPAEYGDVSHSRGDQVVFTGHAPGTNESENAAPQRGLGRRPAVAAPRPRHARLRHGAAHDSGHRAGLPRPDLPAVPDDGRPRGARA